MAAVSTIFALSSGPGRAGVAVIRISGPSARAIIARMAAPVPDPRHVSFRTIRHPETGDAIDKAVVFWFAGPASETGEDVAELQLHGGRAVVRATLDALGGIDGCRLAEHGEFARRAFLNGKIDLVEVEGLADLVDAETEAQRRQALAQAGGVLSRLYEGWRTRLIEVAALAEAAIDFSDEGDVGSGAMAQARTRASPLRDDIARHLADGHRGEILRDGFRVALLGPPNAGKSSLLNALARREAAIVSEEAGTTRDVIEVRLDLKGLPVIVSDTAGVREATGAVEREGIRRSFEAARAADLVLWLSESGVEPRPDNVSRESLIDVRTKADLSEGAANDQNPLTPALSPRGEGEGTTHFPKREGVGTSVYPGGEGDGALAISSKTGEGVEGLIAMIAARAGAAVGGCEDPALTQTRHRQALEQAAAALDDFLTGDPSVPELRAEDVRRAAFALGRITGRVDVEDVLDQIFSRFCIGK
ncbi:MAG: tRNA uridine-5-carboxymethylaminomethyl(34) synthesis GTPase MnmE [Hyphomicrobium sp.]